MTKSFAADVEAIGPIRLLRKGSIVLNGQKQGQQIIKQYNLHTGAQMSCVDVPEACGLSPVELHGRPSLALSFM